MIYFPLVLEATGALAALTHPNLRKIGSLATLIEYGETQKH